MVEPTLTYKDLPMQQHWQQTSLQRFWVDQLSYEQSVFSSGVNRIGVLAYRHESDRDSRWYMMGEAFEDVPADWALPPLGCAAGCGRARELSVLVETRD